jgi:hypothetical protein
MASINIWLKIRNTCPLCEKTVVSKCASGISLSYAAPTDSLSNGSSVKDRATEHTPHRNTCTNTPPLF